MEQTETGTEPQSSPVNQRQQDLINRYGDLLVNTGGNDPAELLADLEGPNASRLLQTNMPRYMLALAVSSQVALLARLEEKGFLI